MQYTLSAVLLLSFLLQQIFNLCKAKNVILLRINKQLAIDVIYAGSSTVVFWYITIQDVDTMYDEEKKNLIDYAIALIMCMSWCRLFMMFTVVPNISNML